MRLWFLIAPVFDWPRSPCPRHRSEENLHQPHQIPMSEQRRHGLGGVHRVVVPFYGTSCFPHVPHAQDEVVNRLPAYRFKTIRAIMIWRDSVASDELRRYFGCIEDGEMPFCEADLVFATAALA